MTPVALVKELDIKGTPGFIVGTDFVPVALDLKDLKDLLNQVRRVKS